MPEIQAFHGLRYNLGHVGSLSDVVAPPYDVIDNLLQKDLYEKHPENVIRLILNRPEPQDSDSDARYERAAQLLRTWVKNGVLQADPSPAIYVYHQEFPHLGDRVVRRGMMCRVRLEPFGEGSIFPHEETHASAKIDRLKLMTACRANLSPVFGLYPDPENEVLQILEQAVLAETPLEATDHLGVMHRFWPVTDLRVISDISAAMANRQIFIADGHHRYETSCDYRDRLSEQEPLDPAHPANFLLMTCVGMSDPGMIVLPTHRLFRGLAPISSQQLSSRLGDCFTTSRVGTGSGLAPEVWEQIESVEDQGTFGFYTRADNTWLLARLTDVGRHKMSQAANQQSQVWQGLGVSILHRLVIQHLLQEKDLPKPLYLHDVAEVGPALDRPDAAVRDATGQEGSGGRFEMACLLKPATLQHVRSISQRGERMPAKSTYFYPKLLSGLVINPLS